MLSKQNRVSSAEVALLFKKAKPVGMPFFVARYISKPGKVQCAVIVPKTVGNKAVLRNSLRRKWSAALRAALQTSTPPSGLFAFVLKKEALNVLPTERVSAFISYFKKVQ